MEGAVYVLCAATALVCAVLLLRQFRRSGARLLLWCGVFFLAMTLENMILFVDVVIVPETDLSGLRQPIPLVGVALLLYGLVWEVK